MAQSGDLPEQVPEQPARERAEAPRVPPCDHEADLLPLRIDAAILLDHVLRLKGRQERGSTGSRVMRAIATISRKVARRPGGSSRSKARRDLDRQAAVLLKSGLFDRDYYLRRNPDVVAAGVDPVLHYLLHGAAELRSPGLHFSTRWYLQRYPDVAASGKNPLYHFIMCGYAEGRLPVPKGAAALAATDWNAERNAPRPTFGEVLAAAPDGAERKAATSARPSAARLEPRLLVYTSLFGNYDDLFVPTSEQAEGCDFVVFTDQPSVPPPWRRGPVSYAAPDRARQSRFHKLMPHRLLPEYEWSLYLDANVELRSNPLDFVERHRALGPDFFVFRHPKRSTILQELGACIGMGKDDAETMVRQVAHYLDSGFRQEFPLTENNVLLRRHNDPKLADLSEDWWAEIRSRSRRDQLSLCYVVERRGYDGIALFESGRMTARNHPDFRLRPHRHQFQASAPAEGAIA